MLEKGADVNKSCSGLFGASYTPVFRASEYGHLEVVKSLLANGATVGDKDLTGHTALNWAAMRNRINVVIALLKKGADVNTKDNNGITPLLYAVGTRNIDMVRA